jgi:hypothetical protein
MANHRNSSYRDIVRNMILNPGGQHHVGMDLQEYDDAVRLSDMVCCRFRLAPYVRTADKGVLFS